MTNKEIVLNALRRFGAEQAKDLQGRAAYMDGTALYAEEGFIPDFAAARARQNMLERAIGFVCRSSAGRVVKLLQPYDSDAYPQEPEELPAQWGFQWSNDPAKARPYVKITNSLYNKGNCCLWNDGVQRSLIDNNSWSPEEYPAGWEAVE